MTVLMWKVNSKKNTIGQCDARCYNSPFPYKYCICEGKNHAVGYNNALINTRALLDAHSTDKTILFAALVSQRALSFPPAGGSIPAD